MSSSRVSRSSPLSLWCSSRWPLARPPDHWPRSWCMSMSWTPQHMPKTFDSWRPSTQICNWFWCKTTWTAWWCWRSSRTYADLRASLHRGARSRGRWTSRRGPLRQRWGSRRMSGGFSPRSWCLGARMIRFETRLCRGSRPRWTSWSNRLRICHQFSAQYLIVFARKFAVEHFLRANPFYVSSKRFLSLATTQSEHPSNFQTASYHVPWNPCWSHQIRRWVPQHSWRCAPSSSERITP